jgi:hypothetical protein
MNITWRTIIWQQFGAAIDMLDNALQACPDNLWRDRLWDDPSERPEYTQFWFLVYHTLYWLDFYLSSTAEGFAPRTDSSETRRIRTAPFPKYLIRKTNSRPIWIIVAKNVRRQLKL